MIHIVRQEEPEEIIAWKKRFKNKNSGKKPSYEDINNCHREKAILKQSLIKQQNSLCAYCCGSITEEQSHIEHIRPKGNPKYKEKSLEYDNILASCNATKHESFCGKAKGSKYDEDLFIDPYSVDCEEFFVYKPFSGEVVAADGNERAKYTIELLNLNSPRLKNGRIEAYWANEIDSMSIEELILFSNQLKAGQITIPYIDVIKYIVRERINESRNK